MWKQITSDQPRPGVIVNTKIVDETGERNEQKLKRMAGNNLWWLPDGSMYVYFTPTHFYDTSEEFEYKIG